MSGPPGSQQPTEGSGPGMRQMMMGGMMGREGWRDADHGRQEWHYRWEHSTAAFFRFKRDNAEIDIKCAEMEQTQTCVQAAMALIDKVNSTQPGSSSTPR